MFVAMPPPPENKKAAHPPEGEYTAYLSIFSENIIALDQWWAGVKITRDWLSMPRLPPDGPPQSIHHPYYSTITHRMQHAAVHWPD
jgi:hypothetical protein